MIKWTKSNVATAREILSRHPAEQFRGALAEIGKTFGGEVTDHSLRAAFQRHGVDGAPSSFCTAEPTGGNDLARLVAATRRAPLEFDALCDRLDLAPSKTRALIEQGKREGLALHVEHGHVGVKLPEPDERIRSVGVEPTVGKQQIAAVISDTHLGSKYCMREQLRDFVHYAYSQGARTIFHPGDVLDGKYRHGVYEVSHVGLDDQARDLFETLPALPGLSYHGITGNHDLTFTDSAGVDVGQQLSSYFSKRGRDDLHFHGNRGAFLRYGGAVFHLWHPLKGAAYAKSYGIQKQIEKYTAIKPQVLLTGHWHIFNYCVERGVHGIACPTFQAGGSAFGNALGGAPAIGGLVLRWQLTKHNTIRNFALEPRLYYEVERPVEILNDLDGTPVERKRRDP